MSNPIVWVKSHPMLTVGAIGVVILLLLVLRGGGGGQTVVQGGGGPSEAEVAANTQVQLATLAASSAAYQADTAAEVENNRLAAQLAALSLTTQSADYATNLGARVQMSGIAAQERIQLSGINAQVQLADMAQETNRAQITANVDMAAISAATYAHMADTQAATTQASYNAQVAIAGKQASASKSSSMWGAIGGIAAGLLAII